MISILPIQPDILQMMAEDTGLTAEGPVWGYFAAEGTKMLGYVVVERAEPVRIIALQCEDFVIADGLLRRALQELPCQTPEPLPFASMGRRGEPQYLEETCRCRWPIPAGERAAWRPFLRGNAPEIQEKSKKPLAFFRWECYHNKVPSNSM